ncbi:protein amnionless-like [Pollicipes pollicipes]|uniref:protein amnionless-like n=1 Tax=Pollicipes pollicipes TaxID=41117 RepID=UPI0018851350|nr:protein amnionless-like [Pollicipes pollicipes]
MSCSAVLFLLSSVLAAGPTAASLKSWGRDLNVDTASNWAGARTPCAGQVALFSANQALAVYVHQKMVTRQLILPNNGEMILGNGAYVAFADRVAPKDSRCKGAGGSTVAFRRTPGDNWFDASSWHQAALPSPVPHAERVPCPQDAVLFPDNMTYRARVERPVAVTALTIGPHGMNNDRFGTFRNSSMGRALFDVRDKFSISAAPPCDPEGCVCGNDRQAVLSAICAATTCDEALCGDAVQPAGHCCKMCGAFVRATADGRLRSAEVSDLVQRLGPPGRLRWHVSRTHDRQIQVVLVDVAESRQDSRRTARALYDKLTGSAEYGVKSAVIQASGPRHAPRTGGPGSGSASGAVIGVLILLLLAGLLVFAVWTKRLPLPCRDPVHLPPPSDWHVAERAAALAARLPSLDLRRRLGDATGARFHFARFRNDASGEVELGQRAELEEVQDSVSIETAETGASVEHGVSEQSTPPAARPPPVTGRSFDNPMFNDQRVEDENVPAGAAILLTPDGKSVANPFFGVPDITVDEVDAKASTGTTPGSEPAAAEPGLSTVAARPDPEPRAEAGGAAADPSQERVLLIDIDDSDC